MKHIFTYNLFESAMDALSDIYYHGTNSKLPFQNFMSHMDGTGVVSSSRRKYGGFFFTSVRDNAMFYGEYLVARVSIKNIIDCPESQKNSPAALKQGIVDNQTLRLNDVLDGSEYSDVVVVPYANLSDVTILEWDLVCDEDDYFEALDAIFDDEGSEEGDPYVRQETIDDFFDMIDADLDYALTVPAFKAYYDSKQQ